MVNLVPLPQTAEDGDGVLDGGLIDQHLLETTLERRVLLDVLPILIEGGGADASELTAAEHRLEEVTGVHASAAAAAAARADHGVDLVDEEDDAAVGIRHLFHHGLEPVLKLSAELCARDEEAHVQRHHLHALERERHVALHDPLRQSLGDGGLTHAGFTDEHGVVLAPSGEDLDGPSDLVVSTDDGVELTARASAVRSAYLLRDSYLPSAPWSVTLVPP